MPELTTVGAHALAALICADASIAPYDATNCRIGVGDSSTAFAVGQTDLQAASNKFRKLISGAPTVNAATGDITWSVTYANGEALFNFNEVGVFNHATAGQMLARKVISLGLKPSNEAWTIDLTGTTSVGS